MATPHVAGVAALVLKRYPALTAAELRARLTTTATMSAATPAGNVGILNALKAVE